MGQVSEFIREIYLTEEINCAETMLRAALRSRGVEASEETYLSMGGFSGGVSVEGLCGVIIGAVAAIGYLMNKGDDESFERSKEATALFYNRCEAAFHAVSCHEIKTEWRREETRCFLVIDRMAGILEQVLEEYGV